MNLSSSLRAKFSNIKRNLKGHTLDNLIWLVNLVPSLAGFSLLRNGINPLFWITHLSLLFYVYGVGIIVFLVYHAQGITEVIKSYVNVSLFILIINISYWFLTKRKVVKTILDMARTNDGLVSKQFEMKRQRLLSTIMLIMKLFYGFNYFNEFVIYMPNRADVQNDYCMTPCAGLEPLTQSPNREVCIAMLCLMELSIVVVVLNYQMLLCLLIAHTAAMYQILSDEINQLNELDEDGVETEYMKTDVADREAFVKTRLHSFIIRHCLILEIIQKLKDLYSVPIGIDLISNAVCIMIFFFLSFEEYVAFSPVLFYCIFVFFLYCFLCQKLINASEVFERAVYSCGWENFKLAEKQKIFNMLVSSQRPVKLLAAYILPLNIATFATTCQSMYKFVTVVKL